MRAVDKEVFDLGREYLGEDIFLCDFLFPPKKVYGFQKLWYI